MTEAPTTPATRAMRSMLALLLLGACGWLWHRAAWNSDDAWVSYRAAENLAGGAGFSWEPRLRVQAYSNPLWVMLLAAFRAAHADIRFVAFGLSAALSALALTLGGWATRDLRVWVWPVGVAWLTSSRSFVDFTSSGLETPLSYALIAGLLALSLEHDGRERRVGFALGLGLLMLARLDLVLVALPFLAHALWTGDRRDRLGMGLALLPLLAWLGFALAYFGTPLPNTYYAKLAPAYGPAEHLPVGLHYLSFTARHDPIGAMAVLAGLLGPLRPGARAEERLWAAGIALQLAYVVWIGGDFMVGRFVAPLVLPATVLGLRALDASRPGVAVGLGTLGAAAWAHATVPQLPWTYRPGDEQAFERSPWVTDERGFRPEGQLGRIQGLIPVCDTTPLGPSSDRPLKVEVVGGLGRAGYFVTRDTWVLDHAGLSDPLVARMPTYGTFFPGHDQHIVPEGWTDTLATGELRVREPEVRAYAERVLRITTGPLWTVERWRDIVWWNLVAPRYTGPLEQQPPY